MSTPATSGPERVGQALRRHHADLHAQGLRPGLDDRDRLRVGAGVDDEDLALALVRLDAHVHRLGGGGGLVEERRVGQRQPREVADHGLEVDEGLEAALRDLGLVGRIGGVPARVLEDVAQDHRRRDRVVVALAEERPEHLVVAGEGAQLLEEPMLGHRRAELERAAQPDVGRHGGVGQGLERVEPEGGQHRRDVGVAGPQVARGEVIGREQGRRQMKRGHGRRSLSGRPPPWAPGGVCVAVDRPALRPGVAWPAPLVRSMRSAASAGSRVQEREPALRQVGQRHRRPTPRTR
jgi:hypothetical protein